MVAVKFFRGRNGPVKIKKSTGGATRNLTGAGYYLPGPGMMRQGRNGPEALQKMELITLAKGLQV